MYYSFQDFFYFLFHGECAAGKLQVLLLPQCYASVNIVLITGGRAHQTGQLLSIGYGCREDEQMRHGSTIFAAHSSSANRLVTVPLFPAGLFFAQIVRIEKKKAFFQTISNGYWERIAESSIHKIRPVLINETAAKKHSDILIPFHVSFFLSLTCFCCPSIRIRWQ